MKKPLFFFTLFCSPAFAESGFYAGLGAGIANISTATTNSYSYLDGSSNKSGSNMVGSIYAGYDFSRYVGIQFDYDYIANVQFSDTGYSFNANQQILDLGITGHLPFGLFANSLSGLSLFGKLAVGYTSVSFSGGYVNNGTSTQALPTFAQNLVPVIGGGVEYGIKSVGIRLEYDYIGTTTVSNSGQNLMSVNNSIGLLSVFYHF